MLSERRQGDGAASEPRDMGVWATSFPLTMEAPRSARRWLDARGSAAPVIRDRAVLLLSELVANSVVHSGLSSTDEVEVRVRSIPGGLRVDVTDDGIGLEAGGPPGDGSFGLRLLDHAADRWGHTDHPTNVWFEVTG
jgi:hypothetical protein